MSDLDERLDDIRDMAAALEAGWTVRPAMLYDEEGVDGWTWTDPKGNEYTELGDHGQAPTWPEEAAKALGRRQPREREPHPWAKISPETIRRITEDLDP